MDILKRDLHHFGLLVLVATVVGASPSFIQKARVINFKKSLSIQTSKIDPPRLAFEEVYMSEQKLLSEWDVLKSKEGTSLTAGDTSMKFVGQSPTQILKNRKVILKPMTFSKEEVEQRHSDLAWVQELPPQAQKRIQDAQFKHGTLDEDWSTPTFKQMAESKIAEVTKQLDQNKEPSRVIVQSRQEDGRVLTPEHIRTATVATRGHNQINLSGMIEIKGLPSGSPQWQIHLARYEEGVKKEDGVIDLRKSTYAISVPSQSGTIIAQMIDTKSGLVLGEGSLRLSPYSSDQLAGKSKLVIEKSNHEIATRFGSFYNNSGTLVSASLNREKPVQTRVLLASLDTEGKTDESGTFRFDQIQKGSWGLIRTESKNFHPAMYMIQSGNEKRLPLFPESMIKALKQIIQDQTHSSEVAETGSIVWGQVIQDGKPLAGAEVDVEFLENYKPVYFNSLLIPDSSLTATSENGYFAFLHIPAGMHSLVASNGHTYLSHANVVVDDDTVSIAELESSLKIEKTDVKVFDSFSGRPQIAQLEMQSLPAALNVNGFAEIQLAPVSRLSLMKVVPQDQKYLESLQIYDDNSDSLNVPLVRGDWLQYLMSARKINTLPNTGIVVGFVPSINFEVYLGHESRFSPENIVFFDTQGRVSPTGVPGGGFVIYNVPAGVQSVVVMNSETNLMQTQVLPMDKDSLAVLKFR